jgi:hypothetical protein
MAIHKKKSTNDFICITLIFFGFIMFIYIASYLALRDFSIFKQPCGKREPLLATFKYLNNYQSNYVPSLDAAKFSYFYKKKFSPFSIFKPLEWAELSFYDFEYHSLSNLQIAEIKKNGDWYRTEYKEMRMYDKFDEYKLNE